MRKWSEYSSAFTQTALERLLETTSRLEYRSLMRILGLELGRVINRDSQSSLGTLVVCTNEDADYLTAGIINAIDNGVPSYSRGVSLACFWNSRVSLRDGYPIAPIIRRYVEPTEEVDRFIVAKSIISSSCTVRTLVQELDAVHNPSEIVIASPVLLAGSRDRLESHFTEDTSAKFTYRWFAEDNERRSDGEVIPGIGGMVYERLGLGDAESKNAYTPDIVRARRRYFNP